MPVFPVTSGHGDFSSTGTTRFIPQIWSGKMVVKYYKTTVFGSISNTDYEGEITKFGDKVIIRTVPDTTINTYKKGEKLNYESPESPAVELNIDQGLYYAFGVDNVDKRQADIPFVEKWSDDASQSMAIETDKVILNAVDADAATENRGDAAGLESASYNLGKATAPVALSKTNILDTIVDCGSVLTEQNVPETGRWMVLPTFAAGLIKKSDLKDASLTGDGTSILRNGRIGMIDRFTLYVSNNYVKGDDSGDVWNILFGHPNAITFAAQMVDTETLPNPDTFGQLIRGLNVYGYKVIKPEALGVLYASKA